MCACRLPLLLTALLLALSLPAFCAAPFPNGHRERINDYTVLHLAGTGAEMGEQHGRLAGHLVRRVVQDVIRDGEGGGSAGASLLAGAMTMEKHLPEDIRAELHALAERAEVPYEEMVTLQLFGDVKRGQYCTSFAMFGPATKTGECIVGRNMDYWDHGASKYAACLIHYTPKDGYAFATTSWAGIINGWTAMNEHGIVCANNSAYGGEDSLEGLSTCFMVRKVVQFAKTVEEGVRIVQETPRACGTNLIIAGGNPPNAAIVEYDHDRVGVRWARNGYVCADNSFRALAGKPEDDWEPPTTDTSRGVSASSSGRGPAMDEDPYGSSGYYYLSRHDLLCKLIRESWGLIDDSMNFAAAQGVAIRSINLHSALLFPQRLAFRVSMSKSPAVDYPYRRYRMGEGRLVSDE